MKKLVLCTVMILMAAAAPATAADLGFYIGAGFGISALDIQDFDPDFADLRFEEDNIGVKIFAGYRLINYFGVEASYTNFGDLRVYEGGSTQLYREAKVGVTMVSGYAVGFIPVSDKVDFFAKVGYASWDADNQVTAGGQTEDRSTNGGDLAFGGGMNFRIKKFGLRVEGDWLDIPDTSDVFLLSLSLMYNF